MSKPSFLPVSGLTSSETMFGPTSAARLLPPEGLPKPSEKAKKLLTCWFFRGLSDIQLTPSEGIVEDDALAHISALLNALELDQTQKMTACSQLVDLWFQDFSWTPAPVNL